MIPLFSVLLITIVSYRQDDGSYHRIAGPMSGLQQGKPRVPN